MKKSSDDPRPAGDAAKPTIEITVVLGRATVTKQSLNGLRIGTVIALDATADDEPAVLVDGTPFANGEVVLNGNMLGLRITALGAFADRQPPRKERESIPPQHASSNSVDDGADKARSGMRVLLIEDDGAMVRSIEHMLRGEGFNVYTTDMGKEGVGLGKLYDYDIIVLGLHLSDMSGFEVLKSLRAARIPTPVLVLVANAELESGVKALGLGADGYIVKPFHKDDLVARMRASVRRFRQNLHTVIAVGQLAIDLDAKRVEVDGMSVHLTEKEYQMLELLALRKGTVLTHEMFLNHLYSGMDEPELSILSGFIRNLRKKLAAANGDDYIETVNGRGYALRDPGAAAAPIEPIDPPPTGVRGRVSYVIGPDGTPLTLADLPPLNLKNWTIRTKAEIVAATRGGLLSLDEACRRYRLTVEEFLSWQRAIERYGLAGLRATRIQIYRK